jgi:hypothetical protein
VHLLDFKILAAEGFDAELTIVSPRSGFLKTTESLQGRCDLRLVRSGVQENDRVYCKVMDDAPGEFGWSVRFTSALPGSWLMK